MGIGHEVWHVEGMKFARVLDMDNIKMDLQGIGLRILEFVQNMDRWGGALKYVDEISRSLEMEFLE